MSEVRLKSKIHKSLDQMDASQLKSAWLILKALSNQQKYAGIKVDESTIDTKIIKGIAQLDNGEGTDFGLFLNEIQAGYGSKK
jgi:hypothetical protein